MMSSSLSRFYPLFRRRTCSCTSTREMRIQGMNRVHLEAIAKPYRTRLWSVKVLLRPVSNKLALMVSKASKILIMLWTRILRSCGRYCFKVRKKMSRCLWLQTFLENIWGRSRRSKARLYLWYFGSLLAISGKTQSISELKACSESPLQRLMSVSWRFTWVKKTSTICKPSQTVTSWATTGKSSCVRCKTRYARLTSMMLTWTWRK